MFGYSSHVFYLFWRNLCDKIIFSLSCQKYLQLFSKPIGLHDQHVLCSCLFSPVTLPQLIIMLIFFIFECLINYIWHTLPGPVPYGYEITWSSICSPLPSFALRIILLTFSLNTLYSSLWNLCCHLSIMSLLSRQFL